MRISRLISQLVENVGPYIPFVGSSPPSTSSTVSTMKHKKSAGGATSPPKGKGKGKDKACGETIDLSDFPINLAEFANGDQSKFVPRYSSVLKRNEQDGVGMEDIDALQMEMEAMLSSVVVRKMALKDELEALQDVHTFKGQKHSKRGGNSGPSSPGKRTFPGGKDSRSAKKLKMGGKPAPAEAGKVVGNLKLKSDNAGPAFDPLQNEQIRPVVETAKPVLPKNETPSRFWAFVEPYCAPITQDDIKLLEDLIKGHSDMTEYYKVPKLGQHYTQRWAKEDLENERLRGAGEANAGDGKSAEEAAQILKKAEAANEETPFGELTQRLVAGLMEENQINPADVEESTKKGSGGESSDTENAASKGQLIKSLNITNAENLEARVRKELEEQGIIDPNEDANQMENDEILEELVRCQNELKAVSAHNLQQLKRLLKAAKEEMARQEVRNKLQQADNEVMEAYRKISQARAKKKPPTKKERDQAWKALKEREIIIKQLESI